MALDKTPSSSGRPGAGYTDWRAANRSPDSTLSDDDYVYNEKDAFKHHHSHPSPRGHSHDSVISHPFSPQASSLPSPNSSVSSGRRQHHRLQDIQLEHPVNILPPPRAHFDPEKVNGSPQSQRAPTHVSASNPDVTAILYDGNDKGPEDKAVQLLLYLSGPCTLFSFLITLWTLLSLFIVLLLCPLRLFSSSRPTLGARITTFLAPPLNLQLNLIYSYSSAISYSPPLLVIIHLFSPIVAMGVAVAAWTAAFFWFFSAILGDPAGQDGHNDGKDSILGVRNWWDRWLSRALR
ncbi:uncharacterized protein BDR25DRAFT_334335 [Lindgomyces ingoldianus]|uniref:Uncharacterized protein n=1 Tax=Lindgomyces ingoldianus TaxID=673940 RepID=A0ACB6QW52_9PLEO|nr:uncharacterized protein BDR25DRAFT_334335 [Lindgomyces ingoldianus]KAF2470740.1 hypothetical protein BDR25DRAFT_334335 [Lindgomyces ingoldianus]